MKSLFDGVGYKVLCWVLRVTFWLDGQSIRDLLATLEAEAFDAGFSIQLRLELPHLFAIKLSQQTSIIYLDAFAFLFPEGRARATYTVAIAVGARNPQKWTKEVLEVNRFEPQIELPKTLTVESLTT